MQWTEITTHYDGAAACDVRARVAFFLLLQFVKEFEAAKGAPATHPPSPKDFDSAAALQSGDAANPTPYWDVGVDGTNQFVQVCDTGFDDASCLLRDGQKQGLTGGLSDTLQVFFRGSCLQRDTATTWLLATTQLIEQKIRIYRRLQQKQQKQSRSSRHSSRSSRSNCSSRIRNTHCWLVIRCACYHSVSAPR